MIGVYPYRVNWSVGLTHLAVCLGANGAQLGADWSVVLTHFVRRLVSSADLFYFANNSPWSIHIDAGVHYSLVHRQEERK